MSDLLRLQDDLIKAQRWREAKTVTGAIATITELTEDRIRWRDRFASLWASICAMPEPCKHKQYHVAHPIYNACYQDINEEYAEAAPKEDKQ